jgi:hypothetical protein
MRLRKFVITTAVVLAICATAYSILLATLWAREASRMRSTVEDLTTAQTEDQAIVDDLTGQVALLTEAVQDNLDVIISLANDRATAQDDQILLRDISFAFQECVSAREEFVGYVKDRALWDEASLRDWESYVDDYCSQVHDVYIDLVEREAAR